MNRVNILRCGTVVGIFLFFILLKVGKGEEKVLTLTEAIDLALAKNPTLKAAGYMVEAANAKVGQARSGFLPTIDFYERYSRTNSPMLAVGSKLNQEIFSARDYELNQLNDPSPMSNVNSQVVFNQPIFDQGKTLVEMKQAKLMSEATRTGMEWVKQEVIFEVIKAYSNAMVAKEDLRVAEEAEKTAEAHVKLAEDLFQAGQVVKSDLLSAQVRLSEVKEMVIQAKNGLTMGRAALNKAIGIEQNEAIEVQGTLEYEPKDLVLEDLINEALQNRPDLLALENQVKNSEEGIKMAKTSFLPSLNFMAQYDLNDKNDLWNASGESWTIWGIFHFNLFEGLNGIYKVKEANESLNQFSSQREALRNEIEFEVRGAFYQLRDAEERVKVAGEAINHAEESLRIVDDRYRVGLSTMVEVLDNEVALTRVKRNYLKAVHDCRVARAKIDLAKGTLSATQ